MRIKFKSEEKWATLSILLIPIFTYLFGTRASPFQFTLSMIGNRFDNRLDFIVWGIICSLIFVFYGLHIFKRSEFNCPKARKALIYSGIFLVLCVITPAIRELWPVLSNLHAIFGAFFGLSLVVSMHYFIKYLRIINKSLYSFSFLLLMAIVGGSVLLLFIFGNSGIFELFFFISISFLLFIMEIVLKRQKI